MVSKLYCVLNFNPGVYDVVCTSDNLLDAQDLCLSCAEEIFYKNYLTKVVNGEMSLKDFFRTNSLLDTEIYLTLAGVPYYKL